MTTIVETGQSRRWLPFGIPDGDLRLYCLPHAGGSASAFRSWAGRLGGVAVCPVQPPGRETRLRDTPHIRMQSLVDELADIVLAADDGPYAVYGHSLGGLVGFELLREIRRRGGPDPVHLIVSGCPAPDSDGDDSDPVEELMSEAQAVALLRRLGGTPEWLLTDPTALQMILPPFIADFAIKQTYRYRTETPLATPITAIAGSDDPRAGVSSMAAWRRQTSRSFTPQTMRGGHFVVLEQLMTTLRHLASALAPWSARPTP